MVNNCLANIVGVKNWMLKHTGILDLLFLASLVLTGINVKLIEITLIPLTYIAICFSLAMFAYFLVLLTIETNWIGKFELFIYNFLIVGNFLTFLLLGLNYLFANDAIECRGYKVNHAKGSISIQNKQHKSKRIIYAELNTNFSKRIVLHDEYELDDDVDSIPVYYRNGAFNYPIIEQVIDNSNKA